MNERLLSTVGILAICMQNFGCGRPEVSYSSDVQPILEQHCMECHDGGGEGVAASGFSVHNYDSVMTGTSLGKVIVPGSSMSSTLYLVIAHKTAKEIQMPPHHRQAWAKGRKLSLSEGKVETIAAWIDQGAQNN